jgi:hypothetical protein
MTDLTTFQTLQLMTLGLFVMGLFSFVTGLIILARSAMSPDVKTLAEQAARLGQKGIAQEVAGLVGNASALVDAMGGLVKTTAGIGVFLTVLGLLISAIAAWLAAYLYRVAV